VYAKEWGSTRHYGDADGDAALRRHLSGWQLNEQSFANAMPNCKLMHCLPVRRNVAVAEALLDSSRSVVLHEAHNRLVVQMAVLYRLLK